MLIVDLKIFMLSFSFCYCITLAYNNNQRYQQHEQHEDSIDWRQRFLTNNNKQLQQQKTITTTTIVPVTSANDIYLKNFKIRHHSRYPNLDRFESKIKYFKAPVTKQYNDNNKIRHDGAGGGHFSKTSPINYDDDDGGGDVLSDDNGRSKTQRHPSIYYANSKVRHDGRNLRNTYRTLQATTTTTSTTTTTVPSVDDDLFDDADEDNDNEYDDDWDDDFDDYYDDDPFTNDDNDDEWQAEEATETSQQQQQQQPISSFTKFKWDNYGSRARVEESRRQYFKANNPQNDTLAVLAHYMKVNQQGQCRRPIPKVIPVQLLHPDSTKSYTPHCTILHRCAEDTGCCSNYETRCGPKKQVPVHLYFYAKTLGTGETKVERLTFYNHTECACLEKSKLSSTPPTSVKMVEENDHENENSGNSLDDYSSGIVTYRSGLQSDNLIRCRCPEEFTPKYRYNSPCSCDCDEHNQDCIRMKKGKEYFSLTDRKCIMENQCGVPVCEYGVYLRQTGRCQRKQEKIESQN